MRRPPIWILLLLFVLLLVAGGVGLTFVPSGQIATEPHEPIDLVGRMLIDGETPEPLHGKLFLVGVETHPINQLQAFMLQLDPRVTIEPDLSGGDEKREDRINSDAIRNSKKLAAAIALEALGEPVDITGNGAVVHGVDPEGPAAKVIKRGDRIVRINGRPATTAVDVVRAVTTSKPGTVITMGVRRDGVPLVVKVATVAPPAGDEHNRSRIGLDLETQDLKIKLPRSIKIDSAGIGGPSAGLVFALLIHDSLSPVDLTRGRLVTATGELSLDGRVMPIGGVRQKAIAAQDSGSEILLVPAGSNAVDAAAAVKEFCDVDDCTMVIPVRTFEEALEMLQLSDAELATKAQTA